MPGFDDCRDCEYRDRPEVCHSLASGHRPLCRPEFRAFVRRRTEGGSVVVEREQEPRPRRRAPLADADRERNRRFAAMHRCPSRSHVPGRCSDCVGRCADRGGEVVAAAVCLECPRTLEP